MKVKSVLLNPLVTEKTTRLQTANKYGFEVGKDANKNQIKDQIEKMYQVEVSSVRIVVRKGKVRRVGKQMRSKKQADRKIAYISLSKGTISVFPKA
jgi:large subunit ribosomal protein L23